MWDLGSASFSANKAKNNFHPDRGGGARQPVCQQISVDQNKLFQETAGKQDDLGSLGGAG